MESNFTVKPFELDLGDDGYLRTVADNKLTVIEEEDKSVTVIIKLTNADKDGNIAQLGK